MDAFWITAQGSGSEGVPERVFPYWSFTKTVLAICALRLAEDGELDLDAQVSDAPCTLRQLLDHSGGLPDYGPLPAYRHAVAADEEPWPTETLFRRTMAQGVRFAPGQGWAYSNLGYMLARQHIETVSGQRFGALIRDMIAAPLGLRGCRLAESREDFAQVHWPAARRYHPGWVYHGCLIGTAEDAALILHALFDGRLVSAHSLTQMLDRHELGGALEGRPWTLCGYGLGLMTGEVGAAGRASGHSGAGPFSVNAVYHFPDLPRPVTVASFTDGHEEGVAEFDALRIALREGGA
ncbi:serine hydrolase [Salipiger sp. CCB-MM3]|uniref:serine hydrolase domain-containing protein n=1 Tax=Salipiger sp. CCB-MM3 TaxID=1792508 RepID=UPI00080AC18A|nr:serine hydrolase domain-containing protein [Salipiger sp. CCB-MM3]ANT61160.1 serine hydrolase [Salipiger sp. CCB-MM3]